MTLQVNPAWLVDEVTVEKRIGEGDYNKPEYAKPIKLEKVRVDLSKQYSGTGNDRTIAANATVFLYAKFTSNFPDDIDDSWLKTQVTYLGHQYQIVDWSFFHEPTSAKPFSIELKVI